MHMHTQLEGDEGPSVALKHTLEAAIVDFFNRNATSHAHGDKYLPYQLFEPASEDYRCVLDWLVSRLVNFKRRHPISNPLLNETQCRRLLPAGAAGVRAGARGLAHRRRTQGPHPSDSRLRLRLR